jgi:hypothetical protein
MNVSPVGRSIIYISVRISRLNLASLDFNKHWLNGRGYTIDDLKGEKQFLVNMDISVCFEAHGPCVLKIPILTEVRLPKPLCNLESGFSFPSKEMTSL